MNTISSGTIIRQKATAEMFCRLDNPVNLFHPREDYDGNYYVCSHSGEILKFNENGNTELFITMSGQPNCLAFDNNDYLYYADLAHGSVKAFNINSKDQSNSNNYSKNQDEDKTIKEYEGTPLKGPTSLAYNRDEDYLVFCDSGYFGTSSLNKPLGSVFFYDPSIKSSRALMLNCLANPSDLALDQNRNTIYICETFTNRIIRIIHKDGIYNSSIFFQFSGRVGPTAIALDENLGNLYIARYEFQNEEGDVDGLISVINKEGALMGELVIPKLPEITGLLIPSKNKDLMYLTEKNSNGIFRLNLTNFISEIDKLEENNKL
jgi:sugar lactone lactonase YvrE